MNLFVRFLNYWAGVDGELLRRCPHHERSKYANSGALVLVTGIFAFSGAAYAVFTVYESVTPALFYGAVWALMIVNLDRLLLTTFPKNAPRLRQFSHALPRLVLAGFVGFTIAHPITVRLFQPEITEYIKGKAKAMRDVAETERLKKREIASAQALARKRALPQYGAVEQRVMERDRIGSELAQWTQRAAGTEQDIRAEIDGTAPSRRPACGPICREKKNLLLGQKEEMRKLRTLLRSSTDALAAAEEKLSTSAEIIDAGLRSEIDRIDHDAQFQINSIESTQSRSFFARSSALDEKASGDANIRWMRRFLAAMLIVIEIIVVLVKLLTPADSADQLAAAITAAFRDRIPAVAAAMAGVGSPVDAEPPEPEPVYQTDPAIQPPLTDDVRRRNVRIILTTLFIVVSMSMLGSSVADTVATGSLFVATAPFLAWYRRRRKEKQ